MKLEILGCSGDVTGGRGTTAYLVNDRVLFDAGAVTDFLPPSRFSQISHVFLSHIHLDHVKGLCFLSEELSVGGHPSISVLADPQVIEAFSLHVFNNALWPDFSSILDDGHPVVRLQAMDPGVPTVAQGLSVKAIPVNHRVRTTGFLVREGENAVLLTSDTGMTEDLWETAKLEPNLRFIVAHVAFPDRLAALAQRAGHMTPSLLFDRIETYGLQRVTCYVAHLKTKFAEEICDEIRKAKGLDVRIMEQGSVLVV